jgi:Uma2 family endonuclease
MHKQCLPVPVSLGAGFGLYRFSVAKYRRMVETGILTEGEPVELLEGYLVNQPRPLSPLAATARSMITECFLAIRFDGRHYRAVTALALADSEPEPDFAVVVGDLKDYRQRFPGAGEVELVGEISESSLVFDRSEKGRIYARAGIPVYWVINVADRQVEVYSDPDPVANPPAYRVRTDYKLGDQLPITLDGTAGGTIPVSDLLP